MLNWRSSDWAKLFSFALVGVHGRNFSLEYIFIKVPPRASRRIRPYDKVSYINVHTIVSLFMHSNVKLRHFHQHAGLEIRGRIMRLSGIGVASVHKNGDAPSLRLQHFA